MGVEKDYMDLDPALKDLLAVWGQEVSSHNLNCFFPEPDKKVSLARLGDGVGISSNRRSRCEELCLDQ